MAVSRFRPDDLVRRISKPEEVGRVLAVEWDEQTEEWVIRVLFGTGRRGVPETDLEPLTDRDVWDDTRDERFSGLDAFQALLTYERLRKPPSRIAASFGSAKAAFYPYQFKPLLKFLENPKQRLLIADDVGLGKTVEAGYILRELKARQDLDRVLIVVPARLRYKWKNELLRRFDESFELVGSRELLALGRRMQANQDPEGFHWITSYESARLDAVVEMLATYQPPIDLVIVDEAHRLRNPDTAQHRLGRTLRDSADAMIFLTATPVQIRLENLFHLLNLLDPEAFAQFAVFEAQIHTNRPIIQALDALRQRPADAEAAASLLSSLRQNRLTRGLAEGTFYESILDRTRRAHELSRDELVGLQRDISELTLTGQIISRTRKLDVIPNRPQRRPQAPVVRLTREERAFYDAVAGLCRLVRPDLDGWGLQMSALMAYRYTASCIPAAAELFREKLLLAGDPLVVDAAAETEDEWGWLETGHAGSGTDGAATRAALRQRLADLVHGFPSEGLPDTKFETFQRVLQSVWRDDETSGRPARKVVVFSFFKRTLRYLSRRLAELDIAHHRIDGDVSLDEREFYIEEFASQPKVRVLLSSEVGAEGIDLQFASVLVNYDLPWNPMMVEQRIGRLDRIGQGSPSITIVNLAAKDTVEERILLRLYERIGIFKDTIGDLDPILGRQIEELVGEALKGELSKEDQERRAEETADAVSTQERTARDLSTQADALMAADQAFLDEVEALVGKRRIPVARELWHFLRNFLARRYPGSSLPATALSDVADVLIVPQAATDLRAALGGDAEVGRLARRIETGRFQATFNQDVAIGHARAELIHPRHPLVRFAFRETERTADQLSRSFAIRLPRTGRGEAQHLASIPAGLYAFSVWLLDLQGVRPRTEILPLFCRLDGDLRIIGDQAEAILLAMLSDGEELDPRPRVGSEALERARVDLAAMASSARGSVAERERTLNEARAARQQATVDATHRSRVDAAKARLGDLEFRGAADFALRMARLKLEKAQREREAAVRTAQQVERLRVEDEQIAAGIVQLE